MLYFSAWVASLFVLLLGDAIGNPLKSAKFLPVLAYELIIPTLILAFILGFVYSIRMHTLLRHALLFVVLPLLTIVLAVLSYLGTITEINQVYAWTRMHQSQLGIVVLYTAFVLLLNQTRAWWQSHLNRVILLTPFVLALFLWIARMWPMNYFLEIVKEDRIIEYSQFFVLFGGGIFTGHQVLRAWRSGNRSWQVYVMALVSFALLVIAGDEISWGQRLLGLTTPESIAAVSRQGEITIHNLDYFEWLVGRAYFALALLGLFGRPLLRLFFGTSSWLVSLFPTTLFVGYFLFPAYYHGYSLTTEFGVWREWSEPIELYLYAGMVFWIAYMAPGFLKRKK